MMTFAILVNNGNGIARDLATCVTQFLLPADIAVNVAGTRPHQSPQLLMDTTRLPSSTHDHLPLPPPHATATTLPQRLPCHFRIIRRRHLRSLSSVC